MVNADGDRRTFGRVIMFDGSTFGKNLDILQRNMGVSMTRRSVIANNIANAETPNFKRSDVTFEAELGRALASENKNGLEARVTDSRHIAFNKAADYKDVKPRRVLDYLTQTKNNGNNVDIEVEMMQATQNQMMYDLMASTMKHEFRMINMVLR